MGPYKEILIPTRAQPDTLISIFILRKFGESHFPDIEHARIVVSPTLPQGETLETLDQKGVLLLDIGGGEFDHHRAKERTTLSSLIAKRIGVETQPALQKLLAYAERDDFYGKGIISTDALDRAFGLSGLIVNLNKKFQSAPERVFEIVLPLIEAHYEEELRRTEELPKEFEEKKATGAAITFSVKQGDKKLLIAILSSDNGSMSGYLRSQTGGRFDVVVQGISRGHINIMTRPTKRVKISRLAGHIRMKELEKKGVISFPRDISRPGRIPEVPEWYYDPATNSIQNGGWNPGDIPPTRIPLQEFKAILEGGL